jgi:protein TonB
MKKPTTRRFAHVGAIVATLAFSLAAYADSGDLTPISKVAPEFPREALAAGADTGMVKARMTIDAAGEVTRVDIVDAHPRRVFDRAVVKTLSQWKFTPGGNGRSKEIDIEFKR